MVDRCSLSFILNSSSNPISEEESRPPTPTQKWLQTILSAPSSPLELPGASNAYEAIHRKRKSPCEPEQQPQHQPLRSNKSRRIGSQTTASAGLVEHIRELTDRAIKATLPNVPLRPQPQPQQPQAVVSTSDVAVCRRNKLLLQQLLNEPFDLIERPADPASDNKRRKASVEQAAFLERVFRVEPMPSPVTRSKIAQKIGLTPKRVQIWFQNKRARLKNDNINTNNIQLAASSTSSSSEDILVSRKGRSDAVETTKRNQQQKRTVSPTPKQSGCFVFHNLALCGDGQLILRSEGAPPLLLEGSLSRE